MSDDAEAPNNDERQPFDEKQFWAKVKRYGAKAGCHVLTLALALYYAFRDEDTPGWAKTVIVSALVYFVSPIDAVPDFLPGGYVDDTVALVGATAMVAAHMKQAHKDKAREQIRVLFGDLCDDEEPEAEGEEAPPNGPDAEAAPDGE